MAKKLPAIVLILIALFLLFLNAGFTGKKITPDQNLYQVVLLTNDQAFYGKLKGLDTDFPYLSDVYYLDPQERQVDKQGRQVGGSKFTVIKRGIDEIHQPADPLYFPAGNIQYWENVGPDSLIAKGIKADKEYRVQQSQQKGALEKKSP